jgi:O-acetyl-ADP-ribose deacetylase (regulator of RNase III)
MIAYTTGDILTSTAEALVNSVNCVGVMGRGIALQFKEMYPENFKVYKEACDRNEVQPGQMFVFATGHLTHPRFIINFPTKRHWRGKSRIADIESGLVDLVSTIERLNIQSIAIPPLGSGLGGLEWGDVRPRIEGALIGLPDVQVTVYEPNNALDAQRAAQLSAPPSMSPGRAALVGLMHSYLGGMLDPVVSLLEVHKMMYFLQEDGEELNLEYVAAPYGPYATNLRHVLRRIEGHLITGFNRAGDVPDTPIALVPGAIQEVEQYLQSQPTTRVHFDRVVDLVQGFETPSGMELLSTVHWAAMHGRTTDLDTIVEIVHNWNKRKKRQFSERQIKIALDVLTKKGWLQTLDQYH